MNCIIQLLLSILLSYFIVCDCRAGIKINEAAEPNRAPIIQFNNIDDQLGTVVGWGRNDFGQATPPEGLQDVIFISAGNDFSLALKTDGTVVGWGRNDQGQAASPNGLTDVIAIAAGGQHSLALKNDGTVIGWGNNSKGQISIPNGLINVTAISAGNSHSLALKSDGTVVGWGDHTLGQITPPSELSNVIAIAAGNDHSLALKSDGVAVGWGKNNFGQAGLADAELIYNALNGRAGSPLQLNKFDLIYSIPKFDPDLGTLNNVTGTLTGTVTGTSQLESEDDTSTKGNLLRMSVNFNIEDPEFSGDLFFVNAISQTFHNLGAFDGKADFAGASGVSVTSAESDSDSFTFTDSGILDLFSGIGNIDLGGSMIGTSFAAGPRSLISSFTVFAYANFEVKYNYTAKSDSFFKEISKIAANGNHSLGLKSNGTIIGLGSRDDGQITPPNGLNNVIALAAGNIHSLALKNDETVIGWGSNNDGQTTIPEGLKEVIDITAGNFHNLALIRKRTITSSGNEETPLTVTYEDIVTSLGIEDLDGNGFILQIEAVNSGTLTKGSIAIVPGQTEIKNGESIVWTPEENQNGVIDAFSIKAYDGELFSTKSAKVLIDVKNINDRLELISEPVFELRDSEEYLYKIVIDDKGDHGTIELIGTLIPTWLNFDTESGLLSGTPEISDVGEHTVKLLIRDGEFEVEQIFTITVKFSKSPATLPNLKLSKSGFIRAMVFQNDGKLIIGGDFTSVNGVPRNNIARLNTNGSVDLTWNPNINSDKKFISPSLLIDSNSNFEDQVNEYGIVNTLTITSESNSSVVEDLFIGGNFNSIHGIPVNKLARISINGNGEPDDSFDFTGSELFSEIRAVVADKRSLQIFVGGVVNNENEELIPGVAGVNYVNGQIDQNWNLPLSSVQAGIINGVNTIALSGENIFIGGQFVHAETNLKYVINVDVKTGAVNAEWRPGISSIVNTLSIYNSHIFIGGTNTLVKVNRMGDGTIDASFDSGVGSGSNDERVTSSSIKGDELFYVKEKLEVIGSGSSSLKLRRFDIEKINISDNTRGSEFKYDEQQPNFISSVIAKNDSVFIGGTINVIDESISLGMGKLDLFTGAKDLTWPVQVEQPGSVKALVRQLDGKLIVGGDFLLVDGVERRNILRVDAGGVLDRNWTPAADGPVNDLQIDETGRFLFAAGNFQNIGGLHRPGVAKLNLVISDNSVEEWNPFAPYSSLENEVDFTVDEVGIKTIELNDGYLYLGGAFSIPCSSCSSQSMNGLVRINVLGNGSIDTSWKPIDTAISSIDVNDILIDDIHVYIGGNFLFSNDSQLVLRINGTGDLDDNWKPARGKDSLEKANTLAKNNNNLYLGGDFTAVGGHVINGLSRISLVGTNKIDTDWNPVIKNSRSEKIEIYDLKLLGSVLYLAGEFTNIGNQIKTNLAKIKDFNFKIEADRSLDFEINDTVRTLLLNGEDVYVGGDFTEIVGKPRLGLAYLPKLDAPVLLQTSTGSFVVKRNILDGDEITHFNITDIQNGKLFKSNGNIQISSGDFITIEEGEAGLQFSENGSVSIVSSLSDTTEGAGIEETTLIMGQSSLKRLYSFTQSEYEINEPATGFASIAAIINKLGSGSGSVGFVTEDGTAFDGSSYFSQNSVANFSTVSNQFPATAQILHDGENTGEIVFYLHLQNPDSNSALAYPTTTLIKIIDYDITGSAESQLERTLPPIVFDANGIIKINIDQPANINGQWRLLGDIKWLDSGKSKIGLTTGNYLIEFKPVSGYDHPPFTTVPVTSGETTVVPLNSAQYTRIADTNVGSLSVEIFPSNIGGQWRVEGSSIWRNHGETVSKLSIGNHVIEFRDVAGYSTPPNRNARVAPNLVSKIKENYLLSDTTFGVTPKKLNLTEVTTKPPYFYNGLIQSSIGIGSGVVVKKRVVLTAAHVLFDDFTLSYVTFPRWIYRKHSNEFESPLKRPRGWVVFSGYQKQRAIDDTPGFSTPESQNLDIAALYFFSDAGEGGFSGYLVTDPDNEWLTGNTDKILVGYPIDKITESDRGKMHATPQGNYSFTKATGNVYVSTDINSFEGNSGGPLMVKNNGNFYPAGIYLGGDKEAIVRAIDRSVVDLINKAETAATGGGNKLSGGAIFVEPGVTKNLFQIGTLTVQIEPNVAARFAKWKIAEFSDDLFESKKQIALIPGEFIIEFLPISGYTTPSQRVVEVVANQSSLLLANYLANFDHYGQWRIDKFGSSILAIPSLQSTFWGDLANPDGDQLNNILEFYMGLDPKNNDRYNADEPYLKAISNGILLRRSKNVIGLDARVEWSSDLKNWNTEGLTEKMMKDLGDAELLEITLPTNENRNIVFFRIVIIPD